MAILISLFILLLISEKAPSDLTSRLKESQVIQWRETFDNWFNRVEKKIPNEYRNSIRENANILFNKLIDNANTLEWL